MTEIQFYQLLSTPLHLALPRLMEKALQANLRVLIRCADQAQLAQIDDALWSAEANSFLPHGAADDPQANHYPIALTCDERHPNGASVLVMVQGAVADDAAQFAKVLDVFDGHQDDATAAARIRWKHYQQQGSAMRYYEQQKGGSWKLMHEVAAKDAA